jgi:hypothetical protein
VGLTFVLAVQLERLGQLHEDHKKALNDVTDLEKRLYDIAHNGHAPALALRPPAPPAVTVQAAADPESPAKTASVVSKADAGAPTSEGARAATAPAAMAGSGKGIGLGFTFKRDSHSGAWQVVPHPPRRRRVCSGD